MAPVALFSTYDVLVYVAAGYLVYKVGSALFNRKSRLGTQLKGPPRDSWLLGQGRVIAAAEDTGALFEQWAEQYGP